MMCLNPVRHSLRLTTWIIRSPKCRSARWPEYSAVPGSRIPGWMEPLTVLGSVLTVPSTVYSERLDPGILDRGYPDGAAQRRGRGCISENDTDNCYSGIAPSDSYQDAGVASRRRPRDDLGPSTPRPARRWARPPTGPSRANSAPRSLRRALLMPQVNPGSLSIAAVRELKSSLWATAGGKGA